MKRNYYNPNEPANSWEISYAVLLRRPGIDLGITFKQASLAIPEPRRNVIKEWAYTNFTSKWLKEHLF